MRWNQLVDAGPAEKLSREEADAYLSEDLVWIVSRAQEGEQLHGLQLDAGWYPEGDAAGSYRLVVLERDWDNILIDYNTRDVQQLKQTIELCLMQLSNGVEPSEIKEQL